MARIQGKSAVDFSGSGGTSLAVTLDSAISSGSLVCGYVTNSNNTGVTSVTDDKSNSYTLITTGGNDTTNGQMVTAFYKENITNAPTTITATWSGGSVQYFAIFADEFSGIATTSALTGTPGMNVQNSPGTSTDGVTSPSTTPGENGALIYGFTQNDGGSTLSAAGTGFTNAQSNATCAGRSEYKTQTTAAAIAATFTAGANESHITGVMAFKAAAGGGGTAKPKLMNSMLRRRRQD